MNKKFLTKNVLQIYSDLESFINKDIDLPIQFAWDLEDNAEKLKSIVEKFYRHRDKIMQPLLDKNIFEEINNNQIKVKKPYIKDFEKANEEINKYMETENELEIKTVSKNDIPKSISVKDLRAIKFMISE